MIPLRLLALFAGILSIASLQAGPPPDTIPETVTPFAVTPPPSSITPYTLPPQAPKSGPPLPNAPPAPAITMLVLVPQDVPSGQAIPYVIQVTNNSTADAAKVKVRMPLPEGSLLIDSEPKAVATNTELTWEIKTLPRGETRKIELKIKSTAAEVNARAYVSYEFGQAVKTRLSSPKLKVATDLPKEATTAEETVPVRVRVTNDGRVPVEKVKLTETISDGFEFHRDSQGETTNNPLTRTWDLGTIPAGTGKTVEFRVMSKAGKELLVRSNVDAGGVVQDSHESKIKIQDAKLKVELRADPLSADAEVNFKATVKNDGSTTLTNVRVVGSVPQDCKVTSRTNGGQLTRDSVQWVIPRLAPGDSYALKWKLASTTAGRKSVRADVVSDRGLRDSQNVETIFAGSAALNWETKFDSPTVVVDRTGMFTVKLVNNGSDAAKACKVVITIPSGVSFVQASPAHKVDGDKITFDPRDVKASSTELFSITFRGERTGQAFFTAKLSGEGDKPLTAEKYVQIISGR